MDPEISPDYLLRAYAWALLKANTEMRETQYGGLVPIVPVSEAPEISDYGRPYIVYGYVTNPGRDLHAKRRGSMTFAVYTPDFRKLTKILTILEEAFGRDDESATDVNGWSSIISFDTDGALVYNPSLSAKHPFVGIRFGRISVGLVEGGTPETTEGGDQSGLININFEYYVDYVVKTKVTEFV